VPIRVNGGGVALSIVVSLAALGCNATCIRDSDCLGHSMCSENRCILLVGRDAGRPWSPDDTNDDVSNESDASTSARDAGN
jgi:hypothetical protein